MAWHARRRLEAWYRANLWFVPLACAAGSFVLLRATVAEDSALRVPAWLTYSEATATALLTAIVGALIALLGVVLAFSMLVVQMAMAQLSPRLVPFWYSDAHLKAMLGIVIGSLCYALLLLTRVRGDTVPALPMLMAAFLVLVSIGAFLTFVQYVGRAVRPDWVAERFTRRSRRIANRCFEGTLEDEERPLPDPLQEPRFMLRYSGARGMVQAIDTRGLVDDARRLGTQIVLLTADGDYLHSGDAIGIAYGLTRARSSPAMNRRFLVGSCRDLREDIMYSLRLLVDIACRALSPAINDPTTAVEMLERIGVLLADLGRRRLGPRWVCDANGIPRLRIAAPTWEDLLAIGVCEIAHYSSDAPQVRRRLRSLLHELEEALPRVRHAAIEEQQQALENMAWEHAFSSGTDRQGIGPSRPGLG